MRKPPQVFLLLLIVAVVAAVAASVSIALYPRFQKTIPQDAHDWVHTQLHITPEQDKALEPIERLYRDKRRTLENQMREGNKELAAAILADGQDSPRVREAIEQIHVTMGDLQKLTIEHVFDMREVLSSEQYQTLLKYTADALYHLDSNHGER